MALSIKSDEADRLARDLAAVTGETLTDAVTEEVQSLPVLDDRDHAEILGYGEQGLPA
jgi:antitoxin VapB